MIPTALALLVLAVRAPTSPQQQVTSAALEPGHPIRQSISGDEPAIESLSDRFEGWPWIGRLYPVRDAKAPCRIELRAPDFDGFLVVLDEAGESIAEDDDGLRGVDARVVLDAETAERAASVAVIALDGAKGAFTLSLEPGDPPASDEAGLSPQGQWVRAAFVRSKQRLSPESVHLRMAAAALAATFLEAKRLEEAEQLARWTLRAEARWPLDSHSSELAARQVLGFLHEQRSEWVQAERDWRQVLALQEQQLGPDHAALLDTLGSLATCLSMELRRGEARAVHERIVSLARRTLPEGDPKTVTALVDLAGACVTDQKFEERRRRLDEALALARSHPGVAANTMANLLSDSALEALRTGDFGAVERFAREVEGIAASPDCFVGYRFSAPLLIAAAMRKSGRHQEAEALLAQTESAARACAAEDPLPLRTMLGLEVSLHDGFGEIDAAISKARQLVEFEQQRGRDQAELGEALRTLADELHDAGRLLEARTAAEESLRILEQRLGPSDPQVEKILELVAAILEDFGDYAASRDAAQRAISICEERLGPDHLAVADALAQLAKNLRMLQDFDGAKHALERAYEIKRSVLGPDDTETARAASNLALLDADVGECATARALFEKALSVLDAGGKECVHDASHVRAVYAGFLARMGETDAAIEQYERAIGELASVHGRDNFTVIVEANNLACCLARSGRGAEAWRVAIESSEATRENLTKTLWALSERERLALAETNAATLGALIVAGEVVGTEAADRTRLGAVLRWKGQVTRGLTASRAQLLHGSSPADRARIDELLTLEHELSNDASSPSDVADPSMRRRAMEARRDEIERELARSRGADDPVGDVELDALAAALPARAAVVEFYVHSGLVPGTAPTSAERGQQEKVVTAWVLRAGSPRPEHFSLGPALALRDLAQSLIDSLYAEAGGGARGAGAIGATGETSRISAARLRAALWDPIEAALRDVDLVIVSPHEFLWAVPFGVLTRDDGRYLIEERSFVLLNDVTEIQRFANSPRNPTPALLAVGDVDYGSRDDAERAATPALPAEATRAGPRVRAAWSRLPFTLPELDAVVGTHAAAFGSAAPVTRLTGMGATEEAVKLALPHCGVIHLATHGFFDSEARDQVGQPLPAGLCSGLVLAGANLPPDPRRDDGLLTAEEMNWIDLHGVDLVTLSACSSALGAAGGGEGMLGLRSALRQAGARAVVASLWPVQDAATARLMASFYRRLWVGHEGGIEALRGAQIELLRENRAKHGDGLPSTWGAFLLDGDWR